MQEIFNIDRPNSMSQINTRVSPTETVFIMIKFIHVEFVCHISFR